MGGSVHSDSTYEESVERFAPSSSHITRNAEQQAFATGKLNPLVDPSSDGVIRRSKPYYTEDKATGLWRLEYGIPMPIETRLDTTGSMGDNVDKALKILPEQYNLCSSVLTDFVLQLSTGIFGDIQDKFVLCRPKFAHSAERLVERLTLMVPERAGGDTPEDPHYGLFGAAYLTAARIDQYGLKGYDFTVSDAPARQSLFEDQITRIFGSSVFEKAKENGFEINKDDLPSTKEIVQDLLKRSHAFFIQIKDCDETNRFWREVFGANRIVVLSDINYLPHIQALIIGLIEGTLSISDADAFLEKNGVTSKIAEIMVRSVAHLPIGEQAILRSKLDRPLPKKGDLFREKTDVWPIGIDEIELIKAPAKKEKIEWL